VKSFISDLVLELAVDSGQTRVGLVTYAGSVEERFSLTRYSRRADMSAAVRAMAYSMLGGPSTATADAIAYVRQVILSIHLRLSLIYLFAETWYNINNYENSYTSSTTRLSSTSPTAAMFSYIL